MVRRDSSAAPPPQSEWLVGPPPDVVAVERVAAVPSAAPVELERSVRRIHDANGQVVDWSLTDPLAGVAAFWAWRRTWERRHPLGNVRDLVALQRVVRSVAHGADGPLDRLLAALGASTDHELSATVPVALVVEAADELSDVRLALEVTGGHGTAIFDRLDSRRRRDTAGDAGTVRTFAPPDAEYVLAATTACSLVVQAGGGLGVRVHRGADVDRLDDIAAVDLMGDTVVVTASDGVPLTLSPDEARPLAWVAPSALRWGVGPIPLADVWRTTFTGLSMLARSTPDGTVVVTTRVPVG